MMMGNSGNRGKHLYKRPYSSFTVFVALKLLDVSCSVLCAEMQFLPWSYVYESASPRSSHSCFSIIMTVHCSYAIITRLSIIFKSTWHAHSLLTFRVGHHLISLRKIVTLTDSGQLGLSSIRGGETKYQLRLRFWRGTSSLSGVR